MAGLPSFALFAGSCRTGPSFYLARRRVAKRPLPSTQSWERPGFNLLGRPLVLKTVGSGASIPILVALPCDRPTAQCRTAGRGPRSCARLQPPRPFAAGSPRLTNSAVRESRQYFVPFNCPFICPYFCLTPGHPGITRFPFSSLLIILVSANLSELSSMSLRNSSSVRFRVVACRMCSKL